MTKKEETEIKKEVIKSIKEKVLTDLNKEIKNSIIDNTLNYKEELKEQLSIDLQNEVADVLRREEKKLLRNKNFSIIKKDILILILFALVLYFGYCLYDVKYFNFMKSDCEKNGSCVPNSNVNGEEGNSIKEEEIIKDKNWYIENYGYLLNQTQARLNADNVNAYYLYSRDYKLDEIKSSYLLNMAYQTMDNKLLKTNSQTITVLESDLKVAFEELFGSLTLYKEGSFSYDCLNFNYEKEKERYVAENHKCTVSNKSILETITDMYEEDNKLYILTTATIYDKNEGSYYTFDDLYDAVLTNVTEENLEENKKKLNKYQYIYKKANDVYYLDSITKLK